MGNCRPIALCLLAFAVVAALWWWLRRDRAESVHAAPPSASTSRAEVKPSNGATRSTEGPGAGEAPGNDGTPEADDVGPDRSTPPGARTAGMSIDEVRAWVSKAMHDIWSGEKGLSEDPDGLIYTTWPFPANTPIPVKSLRFMSMEDRAGLEQAYDAAHDRLVDVWEEGWKNPLVRVVLAEAARNAHAHGYERRYAITLLGGITSKESIDALAGLLTSEENPGVRYLALNALGMNGGRAWLSEEERIVERGPAKSGRPFEPDVRHPLLDQRIVDALSTFVSTGSNPNLRLTAMQTLSGIPPVSVRETIEKHWDTAHSVDWTSLARFYLQVAQTDPDPMIRAEATRRAASCDISGICDAASALMWSDPDPLVRSEAARGLLKRTSNDGDLHLLTQYLEKESDAGARCIVVANIDQYREHLPRGQLLALLHRCLTNDPDESVRINAAGALSTFGTDSDAWQLVRSAVSTEQSQRVQKHLKDLLAKHDRK